MKRSLVALFAMFFVVSCIAPVIAGGDGKSLYESKCAMCHDLFNIAEHETVGKPADGRELHPLPQSFGTPLHDDCTICHDFSQ